jgi:hypothetical protein
LPVPEAFFDLSPKDRRDALLVVAGRSGRPAHLLEKDIWVVWTLGALFEAPFAEHLVLKGGTSLSKAYRAIQRFSEDVDVTYDIRAVVPELAASNSEGLPANRSQEQKWTKTIRTRLAALVRDAIAPILGTQLRRVNRAARLFAEGEGVRIEYDPFAKGSGYVRPVVLVEFGARSTGEPFEKRTVTCDAAAFLTAVSFPESTPTVMRPERTFWEKATAIHVFCRGGRFPGAERFSRHWYDVASLDRAGYARAAMGNRALAQQVARHKSIFFREKDDKGAVIDYEAAVRGGLLLVPNGPAKERLAADYARMVEAGLLFEDAPDFRTLMARCREIQTLCNQLTAKIHAPD